MIPDMLVLATTLPEAVFVLSFTFMVWLVVTSYLSELPDAFDESKISLAVVSVVVVFTVAMTGIYSCLLVGVISSSFVSKTMLAAELTVFLASICVLLFVRCRYFSQESKATDRVVAVTLVGWAVSRVLQGWFDIYYTRTAAGMILCVQ